MEQQIPLSHEASAGDTHIQTTEALPPEVVQCLDNARFVNWPQIRTETEVTAVN